MISDIVFELPRLDLWFIKLKHSNWESHVGVHKIIIAFQNDHCNTKLHDFWLQKNCQMQRFIINCVLWGFFPVLHDNARSYTARQTKDLLDEYKWNVFYQPTYRLSTRIWLSVIFTYSPTWKSHLGPSLLKWKKNFKMLW